MSRSESRSRTPTRTSSSSKKRKTPARTRSRGFEVIRWIETHCRHTNGRWIGKPFRLLRWQKLLILALFAVDARGRRIYRWALIGVPKKNGKTELAAALGLYFLIGSGEPAPLVVCAAASDDQADLVFGAARIMCELSPTLSQITERYEDEILVPSIPGAILRRVAAVAGTNDGPSIYVVICDELHEWTGKKGEAVWNVLTNGTGAREEPLVLQITTAGFDLEGTICGQQYEYCKRIESGEISDPRYFFSWVEAPENAKHDDPAVWKAANPSFGVLVQEEFFRDQLTKKTEAVFRRYFLNQWTQSEEIWELAALWDALEGLTRYDTSVPLYVATDVGVRHDSSAVAVVQLCASRVLVEATIWENPYPPKHTLHDAWKFDIAEVKQYLRELRSVFPAKAREKPGPAFFYDPHFFEDSAQELEGEGLNMLEFPQTNDRLVPASQRFFELGKTGVLMHNGNPALRRHIRNVVPKETDRGWRISRPRGSRKKVDGAVAAAIATFEATRALETPTPTRFISLARD